MTPTRTSAIAALVTAIGLTSFAPVAFAEGPQRPSDNGGQRNHRMMETKAQPGGMRRFEIVDFACNAKAADRMDGRYDKLVEHLKLTADQEKLFETFRTTALTAQTRFNDTCSTVQPEKRADRAQRPDPITRMETRLKVDEARLSAMTSVLPDLKAFYASLTDAQKQQLTRGHFGGHRNDVGDAGNFDMQPPGAPGGPMAPDMPAPGDDGLDG
jgi:hypothetical protein